MARNSYKEEKYEGVFSCGHEAKISVGGYSEEYRAQVAEDRFSGLCPECEKKALEEARAEESRKNAEFAKEMGWPQLVGSPKQIAWAETIRVELFNIDSKEFSEVLATLGYSYYEKLLAPIVDIASLDEKSEEMRKEGVPRRKIGREINKMIEAPVRKAMINLLKTENSAKFFIDNRRWVYFIEKLPPYADDNFEEERQLEEEILAENTVLPEEGNDIVVTVSEDTEKSTISIKSPKNEEVIAIAKSLGYRWNRKVWAKNIDKFNGPMMDRIAELAHKLLSSGFGVTLDVSNPDEIKDMIKEASFKTEQKAWIKRAIDLQSFVIILPYRDDSLYNESLRIPGAKWCKERKAILAPVSSYKQVQDYATVNSFSLSDGAQDLIKQYKEKLSNAEVIAVKEQTPVTKKDGLVELLDSPADVLPDLKD